MCVVNKIAIKRGKAEQIFLDNDSEFISKALDKWVRPARHMCNRQH